MRSQGYIWNSDKSNTPTLSAAGRELRRACEDFDARLLVIDTFGAANGSSEVDRAQVGAFFSDWAAWADSRDCTTVLIAHPPKNTGAAYSGSTGIQGGVRALWFLDAVVDPCQRKCQPPSSCVCDRPQKYRLVNKKQNYAPDDSRSVWLTNTGGVWVETPSDDSAITESDNTSAKEKGTYDGLT